MTLSDFRRDRRLINDVEAVTLIHNGSPPITRITFLTCRAHYPGGSSGCSHRYLPRSCSLPRMAGRSASTLSLSRPAQASHILRPVRLLSHPTATFVTRLQPCQLPNKAARQLPDLSTSIRVGLSPTGDPRLRRDGPTPDHYGHSTIHLVCPEHLEQWHLRLSPLPRSILPK